MACDKTDGNCKPCKDCKDIIQPIMPRCQDVVLADGVFQNATVTVDGGCIIRIQSGEPLVYKPDPCCATVGAGGGSNSGGLKGEKGDSGKNATIAIGQVQTVAADSPARVWNSGTSVNAVLNFEIPKGASGESGKAGSGADFSENGLVIENGIIKDTPIGWLVLSGIQGDPADSHFQVNTEINEKTGVLTLSINPQGFQGALMNAFAKELDKRDNQISALNKQLDKLEQTLSQLQRTLSGIR